MPKYKPGESINRTVKTCCWVKEDGKPCGKSTTYTMSRDEDGSLVRNYDSLCPEHRVVADTRDFIRERLIEQITIKARNHGLSMEDVIPADQDIDYMTERELELLWRSMYEME